MGDDGDGAVPTGTVSRGTLAGEDSRGVACDPGSGRASTARAASTAAGIGVGEMASLLPSSTLTRPSSLGDPSCRVAVASGRLPRGGDAGRDRADCASRTSPPLDGGFRLLPVLLSCFSRGGGVRGLLVGPAASVKSPFALCCLAVVGLLSRAATASCAVPLMSTVAAVAEVGMSAGASASGDALSRRDFKT